MMAIKSTLAIPALLLVLSSASILCAAQSTGGPSIEETRPPGWDRPPEQAAVDACSGRKELERVQFVDGKGKKRKWACVTVGGVFAARPGVAMAKVTNPK
jgi:hypothetical protein